MAATPRWHERSLEDGEWLRADFGRLSILVRSTMEEWRVATFLDDECEQLPTPGSDLPTDIEWHRWDRGLDDVKLRFRPIFPDRPVIIRPKSLLTLSPGARARFYVGIPAFIELSAHTEGNYTTLASFPTHRLSNTWHGSPLEGTLCYASKTRARRVFDTRDWQDCDIACAIEISNQSRNSLPFERLFFDTDHLAVFEHGERLWANSARIRVAENASDLNGVVFGSAPPGDAAKAVRLSEPRKGVAKRGIFTKAFSNVMNTFQAD